MKPIPTVFEYLPFILCVSGKRLLMDSGDHGTRIAFYAYMSRNEPVQEHKVLVFDVTKTNYGNGYNNNTGIFIAPSNGVYVLTFTVHSYHNSYASVDIIVNHELEGTIFTDSSDGWDRNAATAIVVVWMNQGDVSFVRTSTTYKSIGDLWSDNTGRCSFAGWKISN